MPGARRESFVNGHSEARNGSEAIELSVIVPTFNEHDNIAPMVALLDAALAGIAWEVIFVDDDSPDGTADAAKALGGFVASDGSGGAGLRVQRSKGCSLPARPMSP